MKFKTKFTPQFGKQLKKLKRRDKILLLRLKKKILEISENPHHYKPLKNILKGTRRAHLDPFIIIFEIADDSIIFHYVSHHDEAY